MNFRLKPESLALLTEQGSLTDLMARLIGSTPVLNCLYQGKQTATKLENQLLNIEPRNFAHIREITMGTKEHNWLFARTVIPSNTLKGPAKRLAFMNKTPLGRFLFGSSNAKRTRMWIDLVFADEIALNASLMNAPIPSDFPLWQRRSIFELSSGPLLISEVFLPDCPLYESQNEAI